MLLRGQCVPSPAQRPLLVLGSYPQTVAGPGTQWHATDVARAGKSQRLGPWLLGRS